MENTEMSKGTFVCAVTVFLVVSTILGLTFYFHLLGVV